LKRKLNGGIIPSDGVFRAQLWVSSLQFLFLQAVEGLRRMLTPEDSFLKS
jgi:hypothetical protein